MDEHTPFPHEQVFANFISNCTLHFNSYISHIQSVQTKSELLPITSFPPITQEQIILDDLLFILMGIDGKYIKMQVSEDDTTHFTIDPSIGNFISIFTFIHILNRRLNCRSSSTNFAHLSILSTNHILPSPTLSIRLRNGQSRFMCRHQLSNQSNSISSLFT